MNKEPKLKTYHVQTLDGRSDLNYLCNADSPKEALLKLIANSYDYQFVSKDTKEIKITIKELFNEPK